MPNFLKKIFSSDKEERTGEISTGNLTMHDDFWYGIGGFEASSGMVVSKISAMRQWAVYACVSEIAVTLAQLPLKLKRPDEKGGKEDATDHPLYDLLKNLPNKQMTSFNFREAQQANILTDGNCYSFITRSRATGDVTGLYPLDPTTTTPRLASRREMTTMRLSKRDNIVYDVETDRGRKTYPSSKILHIVGFGFNGLKGESVITNYAKESIGNAIALDKFQGASMRNGVHPSGVLEHPDTLGDRADDFLAALTRRYSSPQNAKRPMVLENGMKWAKADVSFVDKQFIEQMKMTANQISAGIFKVPPHRIGIYEKNTNYNNTEQGNKAFLDGTMQQWVVRWEQAMNWKLLTESERRAGYYFKFNFDALLRPDAKTRSEIAWREWQMGTPLNEIRKVDDKNPVEHGDKAFIPGNMVPVELAGQEQAQAAEDLQDSDMDSLRRFERKAVERLVKRDSAGNCEDFETKLDGIYNKVNEMLEDGTRLILRCFNDDTSTNNIIAEYKHEFQEKKRKIIELRKCNYEDIEGLWS